MWEKEIHYIEGTGILEVDLFPSRAGHPMQLLLHARQVVCPELCSLLQENQLLYKNDSVSGYLLRGNFLVPLEIA